MTSSQKLALFMFSGLVALAIVGCVSPEEQRERKSDALLANMMHTKPDKYGVVCYSKTYAADSLSCVKVQEPHL